jgi:hypothetical protein
MKTGDTVKVLTSLTMPDEKGRVREITNQGRVVVEFSGSRVGFYTLGQDEFEIIESA